MASESPFDDELGQSPEECWKTIQVLRSGDDVLINHREQPLTVRNVVQRDDGETVQRITLSGNGTEYTITAAKEPNTPFITCPSSPHSRPVQKISAAGSTILSTVHVVDLWPHIEAHTSCVETEAEAASSYEIDLTQILGECPICESMVVADRTRAICRGCNQWIWLDQWEECNLPV